MDKKALFIATLNADPAFVGDVSENRFSTFITRNDKDGNPENVTTAEFCVWTQEEAEGFGYLAGGIQTTEPTLQVFRIF